MDVLYSMPKRRRKLSPELEKNISLAKKQIELITAIIHDIDEEDKIEESDSESTKDSIPKDEDYTPKKGKQKLQEEIKTPEGNVIELAQVKVEEEKKKA